MTLFESSGMGAEAEQELQQQDKDTSFILSLLMTNMLLKSSASFTTALNSFFKANEMFDPDKWTEYCNGAGKLFQQNFDSMGFGGLLLKDMPTMGSETGGGEESFAEGGDAGGDGGNIAEDYAAELGAATSASDISPVMQESFTDFMSEYTGIDFNNMASAGNHVESAGESYTPSPPPPFQEMQSQGIAVGS